jgi:hypothetical protein
MTAAFTVVAALFGVGCGFFGPGEAVKHDSGSTVYRAAEPPPDVPETTSAPEQVPGEKRPKMF